jgi:hypothetical protein
MAGAEGSAHTIEEARLGRLRLTSLADGETCVGRLVPQAAYTTDRRDGRTTISTAPLFILAG